MGQLEEIPAWMTAFCCQWEHQEKFSPQEQTKTSERAKQSEWLPVHEATPWKRLTHTPRDGNFLVACKSTETTCSQDHKLLSFKSKRWFSSMASGCESACDFCGSSAALSLTGAGANREPSWKKRIWCTDESKLVTSRTQLNVAESES